MKDLIGIYEKNRLIYEAMSVEEISKEYQFMTDFILFSLMLNFPIMRTQNYLLVKYDTKQTAAQISNNGIYVDEKEGKCILYYNNYKSFQKHGFIQKYLPEKLALEVITYVKYSWEPSLLNEVQYLFQRYAKGTTSHFFVCLMWVPDSSFSFFSFLFLLKLTF